MTIMKQRENPTCVYPTLIGFPVGLVYQIECLKSRFVDAYSLFKCTISKTLKNFREIAKLHLDPRAKPEDDEHEGWMGRKYECESVEFINVKEEV